MARPPALPADEKADIVLSLLSGKTTLTEAARRAGVTEQAVGNWKHQFILAGSLSLCGRAGQSSEREHRLRAEVNDLKQALGEMYALLWSKGRAAEVLRPVDDDRVSSVPTDQASHRIPERPDLPDHGFTTGIE